MAAERRRGRFPRLFSVVVAAILATVLLALLPPVVADAASALPSGFQETTVFSGLTNPISIQFSKKDGRVFVAEKSGLIKVFDGLSDTTPTTFADLRTNVHNFWDRGMLGMALDPGFPDKPYVYVLYTHDAAIGGTAPRWGTSGATSDPCPTPPGATGDGCVVSGHLSRLQASGSTMTGSEQVLIEDWCQQYPSHSVGGLAFGSDGALYVSGGDGASFNFVDYGQDGSPLNPCGDPPAGVGGAQTPPTAEGGALRSQDRRTTGDPVSLDGTILRVNPDTGAALPDNPLSSSTDPNARRIVADGLRNPFRITTRPGTSEVWAGDVGWNAWEEIDRITTPTGSSVRNFGWPCYEGAARQSGYDGTDLSICENLYGATNAVTAPYYAYNHSSTVVTGESCPTGSSSVAGLAFYETGPYPDKYDNALFFADYSRNCIWAMTKGTNGLPDPATRETFAAGAASPVDLKIGPGGDLFYADFNGGTIRRISYGSPGGTTCPTGQFLARYYAGTTTPGTTPTSEGCEDGIDHDWGFIGGPGNGVGTDNFSARWTGKHNFEAGDYTFTATADDGIRVWVDDELIIDQWIDQAATTYEATRTMSAGEHEVRVEYYEAGGAAVAQVDWQKEAGAPTVCPTGQYAAQYYAGTTTPGGTPTFEGCETQVNYDWDTGGPGNGVGTDNFSARWTGKHSFEAGNYVFTVRADDGVRVWVDGTLIIDQWIDQPATTYTATRAMTAGEHEVRIEYYEAGGLAVAEVSWQKESANTPPTPTISSPSSTLKWKVGDAISFSGSATDTQDGTLPASALSWSLIMHHCSSDNSSCHQHPVRDFPGVRSGSFTAPDHEYPSYLELRLTATDSGGATATKSVRLDPQTVSLTFQSSPTGLNLVVGSSSAKAPFSRTVIVGSSNSISAPSPQVLWRRTYYFSSWSDGKARSHNITAPATSTTYTAYYRR